MAAITTAIAAVGTGLSVYQAVDGMNRANEAKNAINNYKRQDLTNPFKDIAVSTVGSDLLREEAGRTSANLVDNLRIGGTRAIFGGIPRIQAGNNAINKDSQAYLDEQVNKRNYAIANDETNIRNIQENRDNADLAGLGNAMDVGRQDMWNGLKGIGSSAMFALNNIPRNSSNREATAPIDNSLTPKGVMSNPIPSPSSSFPGYRYYDPIMGPTF